MTVKKPRRTRSYRLVMVSVALAMIGAFGVSAAKAQTTPRESRAEDPAQKLAGAEMCGMCHEEIFQDFFQKPHRVIATSPRWGGESGSCESCHGAGAKHSESMEVADIYGFKPHGDRVNQTCLECHAGDETQRARSFGAHTRNQTDCLSCHSVHLAPERKLLVKQADELCSSCHLAERTAFLRPFHHRLEEGAISCIDCHDPHGAPPPAEATRVSANEPTCLKCHADKRGPFPFEHAPVKMEPCTGCHEAHGSANPRMMVRANVSQLCLECHAGSLATLGGPPPAFHDMRTARFRNCTVCHSKIHGSFVSKDFLK